MSQFGAETDIEKLISYFIKPHLFGLVEKSKRANSSTSITSRFLSDAESDGATRSPAATGPATTISTSQAYEMLSSSIIAAGVPTATVSSSTEVSSISTAGAGFFAFLARAASAAEMPTEAVAAVKQEPVHSASSSLLSNA
jgi:hypothetical protein